MLNYTEMARTVESKIKARPNVALILGSGLGYLSERFEDPVEIDYSEIPGFPDATVQGHSGKLVFGTFHGARVVAMKGRFHFYEGHGIKEVVSPIYLFKELGISRLLITNASGGINKGYTPGDIVAVTDIINYGFKNPLRGKNLEWYGPRFPDMSDIIDRQWYETLQSVLEKENAQLREGTYCWTLGPTYETPAEIKMFEYFGADLVGMSTVPEVIAAKHCKMKILVLACVTNMASGITKQKLSHEDVVNTANRIKTKFSAVVAKALEVAGRI